MRYPGPQGPKPTENSGPIDMMTNSRIRIITTIMMKLFPLISPRLSLKIPTFAVPRILNSHGRNYQ